MIENTSTPQPRMAADLRRLQHAREVMRAVEQRTQVNRAAPTGSPADVVRRLVANRDVRAAVKKLIGCEGESNE